MPLCSHAWRAAVLAMLVAAPQLQAQLVVSESGTAVYSMPIAVPPGIAGMSPNIGLQYTGGGVNGPVGFGWSVQGISLITRCPGIEAIDGAPGRVGFSANDKLCLDGQRLIQTNASGVASAFPQSNDSLGGTGQVREYRTEKDSFSRIRAYGMANGAAANGPAYFKVWTKSGQTYEYGNNANPTANAGIAINGKTALSAWAVSRISDSLGNYIDFQYTQRSVAWGSGPVGSPTPGNEWSLVEVRYTGTPSQQPVNKVVFEYLDRTDNPGAAQDRSEAYQQGAKNVSVQRLNAVRTWVNWPANVALYPALPPATAIKVKTSKLTYEQGARTGRSRVSKITECAGVAENRCPPPATFTYADGGNDAYQPSTSFNLGTLVMQSLAGTYGVLTGNFMGNGRSDILRWSDSPAENQLYRSNGDGSFTQVANGSGNGQFNITDQNLFKSDACYSSLVADFNGDGIADILRYAASSCPSPGTNYLYIGGGTGSFTRYPITGPALQKQVSLITYACEDGGPIVSGSCGNGDPPGLLGWTTGKTYYVLDVDGDGRLDIVTADLPGQSARDTYTDPCALVVCTKVWLGNGQGVFTERTGANIANQVLFTAADSVYSIGQPSHIADVDGDGLADILGIDNLYARFAGVPRNSWRSRGDGNFDAIAHTNACAHPLDFNGDGRADCMSLLGPIVTSTALYVADGSLSAKLVGQFNLGGAGKELSAAATPATVGSASIDVDGDGRSDILRWKDDPQLNTVYLSNGDGSFRESTSFNLKGSAGQPNAFQLQSSDGTAAFLAADFTGRGRPEILRVKAAPVAGANTANQLYVKSDPTPPDQLVSVTSGSGLKTDLTWVPLTNSASGTIGTRYSSDRGTASAATFPKLDLMVPMQVVATSAADSGVGTSRVTTEYSYAGLKAAFDGRGVKGFRQTSRQAPGPDGSPITVVTQYLQDHPYTGVASQTDTYPVGLGFLGPALPIGTSTFTYCDKSATPAQEAAAGPTTPCLVAPTVKIQRPYLYRSVESGRELPGNGGAALPTVTTTNTFNGTGDPTRIVVSTAGTALGLSQTVARTTDNVYAADDTAGDAWTLGRLARATQQSSVPNSLPSIAAVAGSAPLASAIQGVVATLSLSNPSFSNVAVGQSASANASLSNTGSVAARVIVPGASAVSGTDFSFVSTTCLTSLAPGASCTVTVRFSPTAAVARTGTLTVATEAGAKTASLAATGLTAPVLALSACASATPTTTPTAATMSCTLRNTGQVATASIAYSTASGTTVNGPSGVCAGGATCGTVTVTTSTAAGTYSGTLTATPNVGIAASTTVSLVVRTQATLDFSACSSTSPTAPTRAVLTCTLRNLGQTPIGSIGYSAIAGSTVAGPTGACAGGATCGSVTVTSGTAAGTYSGTLTATPNVGNADSTAVSLVVKTPAVLAFSGCSSTSPTTTPTRAVLTCTLSNTGQTAIGSIGYSTISGSTVAGPTGACAGNATCGTVTVTSGTAAGTYSGTLTATPNTGSAASTSVSLVVVATSTTLTSSPASINSGPWAKGTLHALTVTIANTGSFGATGLNFTVTPTGGSSDGEFVKSGGTCSTSLVAGASCTVIVTFTAGCVGGSNTATLTTSGTPFTSVVTTMTGNTNSSGNCP